MITLMERKWSRYRGGQFREVEWSYYSGENGHVTKVVTNGGRKGMLQKWSLMEGEWLCYRGGH